MKIYTRSGDEGSTGLIGGSRVTKDDPILGVLGEIDELNAVLGWVLASGGNGDTATLIVDLQSVLFDLGAFVAARGDDRFTLNSADSIAHLETSIDEMCVTLPALTQFILPGGTERASRLHIARTVCRRVERTLVKSGGKGGAVALLNRLSDWLFIAARYENMQANHAETTWRKPC